MNNNPLHISRALVGIQKDEPEKGIPFNRSGYSNGMLIKAFREQAFRGLENRKPVQILKNVERITLEH